MLGRLEACDSVGLGALKVDLWESNAQHNCFPLDAKTFAALCEHEGLVFRDVYVWYDPEDADLGIHKLSGMPTK